MEEQARSVTIRVLHSCISGLGVYRIWLASATPINPSEHCERMATHWRRVTGIVLGEED